MSKTRNDYDRALGRLYERTPKAVFAAIAFSMCFIDVEERGEDAAITRLLAEWQALYNNGIVPQKPPSDTANARQQQSAATDEKSHNDKGEN